MFKTNLIVSSSLSRHYPSGSTLKNGKCNGWIWKTLWACLIRTPPLNSPFRIWMTIWGMMTSFSLIGIDCNIVPSPYTLIFQHAYSELISKTNITSQKSIIQSSSNLIIIIKEKKLNKKAYIVKSVPCVFFVAIVAAIKLLILFLPIMSSSLVRCCHWSTLFNYSRYYQSIQKKLVFKKTLSSLVCRRIRYSSSVVLS